MPRRSSDWRSSRSSVVARWRTSSGETSNVRVAHERGERGGAELALDRAFELLAQPPLDVLAQLGERVELADGARELVVELGQLLLLDLLDGRLERLAVAVGDLLRLACRHADEARLDLGDQPLGAELDHVVALALAVADEVDDDRVALARRPVLGGHEGRGRVAQQLELLIDHLLGDLGLCARHLQRRPVGHLGLRLDVDGGGEAKVSSPDSGSS